MKFIHFAKHFFWEILNLLFSLYLFRTHKHPFAFIGSRVIECVAFVIKIFQHFRIGNIVFCRIAHHQSARVWHRN